MFKRLFCKHDYVFVRNIHGDEINLTNGKRSIWECKKCGKIKLSGRLQKLT
jgi:RNase P subunit RPR2